MLVLSRRISKAIAAACLALAANTAFAASLYILDEYSSSLRVIETQSLGTSALIGSISYGSDNIELVGATSSLLYTFDRDSDSLVTISTLDASVTSVVQIDQPLANNPRGFDLGTDGMLYGVFDGLELRSIDVSTGTTNLIANLTGVATVEAIAFASNGSLFASGAPSGNIGNQLYEIDLSTGAMSAIGSIGIEIDTLGFGADDVLYGGFSGPGRYNLYAIDTASGASTNLGNTGIDSIVGITRVLPPNPSPVPIPATAWLFASALGVFGYFGKRKANA